MSGGTACRCKPRNVEVIKRNSRQSAFDGYRVMWSPYSLIRCITCGYLWRTKGAYVRSAPDAPEDWYEKAHPARNDP